MKVKTRYGMLEEMRRTLNSLWEFSVRLYWKAIEFLGKAIGWFAHKYTASKRFKYFVWGIAIITIALMFMSCIYRIYGTVVHAQEPQFHDYNGDGKIRVSLSAGHGASTSGKRISGYTDSPYASVDENCVHEWTLNDAVCDEIQARLEAQGIEVLRIDDTTGVSDIPLAERVRRIKEFNPDIALSIHHNSSGSLDWCNATGVETYYQALRPESEKLAKDIAQRLSESVGLHNRGAISTDYWKLYMPRALQAQGINSVLVEGGMMDGIKDIPIISSYEGVHEYAQAVSDSVLNWLECGL